MNAQSQSTPPNKFRIGAILLEGIPALIVMLGLLFNHAELKIIGFFTLAGVYMAGSFYLFKRDKFQTSDVFIAIFCGLMLAIILIGFFFQMIQWPNGPEMLSIGKTTLNFGLLFSIGLLAFRYSKSQNRPFEFSMSLKLFSRFALLFLFYYASGLNESLIAPAL